MSLIFWMNAVFVHKFIGFKKKTEELDYVMNKNMVKFPNFTKFLIQGFDNKLDIIKHLKYILHHINA